MSVYYTFLQTNHGIATGSKRSPELMFLNLSIKGLQLRFFCNFVSKPKLPNNMIPKVIHFCWLSNDEYPKKIAKCLKSWDKHLKDYEIRLWDFNRFPRGKSKWVDQAFDNKKYAFAADFIRAYALYHEGGIYLDSDVEVLNNFDEFLHLPYILGQESDSGKIEAAVMGSEPGNEIFGELLKHYEDREFINSKGETDELPLPTILSDIVSRYGERRIIGSTAEFDNNDGRLNVFKSEFFSPIHIVNLKLETTANTVAIHHFAGTWTSPQNRFKKKMQKIVGPNITTGIQKLKALVVGRPTDSK